MCSWSSATSRSWPPMHHRNTGRRCRGFSVSVDTNDLAEAAAIFAALADGGTVNMPFSPTFWAKGFGMVKDKFGTPWMISSGNAGE